MEAVDPGEGVTRIKPHHFLDILRDMGAGREWTPHPYGHALHSVAREIVSHRERRLELVLGADDICGPCRHNSDGRCADFTNTPGHRVSKEEWNRTIDVRWLARLGLREGEILSARDFCRLAGEKMGDIFGIYREADRERTREREGNLLRGIALFLG